MKAPKTIRMTAGTAALLLLFVSCSSGSAGQTESLVSEKAAETTARETETEALTDALPSRDFGEAGFMILAGAEQWQNKYAAEEENGEVLNDAVYSLNREVEERFNIKLGFRMVNGYSAGMSTVSKLLFDSVSAGDAAFDLFCACSDYVSPRILEGVFSDLKSSDYLDFSAPWWYHNVQDNIMIGDNLYVAAGSYGIQTIAQCWCAVYNKEMALSFDLPDLYDIVQDGRWTFDQMLTCASGISGDLDGNGVMDENDRYGILGTHYEPFCSLPYAMGHTITAADSNGIPYLTGVTEHNVSVYSKLSSLMHDKLTYFYCEESDPVKQMIPMFASGHGLFMIYPIRILENEGVRSGSDYGILPLPKFDETQKQYLTSCFPDVSAIPVVVKDEEMSQIILEALNSTAYRTTVPAYYDIVLQGKLTRDEESVKMLDLITAGTTTDFGLLFYSSIANELYITNMFLLDNEYTTWWAKNEQKLNTKLDNILEKLSQLNQ